MCKHVFRKIPFSRNNQAVLMIHRDILGKLGYIVCSQVFLVIGFIKKDRPTVCSVLLQHVSKTAVPALVYFGLLCVL